jgi:CDP-diacylglycerol--glycerol-3-phosphate 3-phosphatidyltransferase
VGNGRGDRLSWDAYAAGWAALHLGVDPRRSGVPVRAWLRLSYLVGRVLARLRVRPGVVTLIGLLLSLAVPAVVVLRGWFFFAGAALVLLAAVADSTDGAVAVMTARATRLGGFDDGLADRVSEAAWLIALWLVGGHGLLVASCGALSWLHEYVRARAGASGIAGIGAITVNERPTRVIAVIAALTLGGLAWMINPRLVPGAVTLVLAVWLVLAVLGLVRLIATVRSALRRSA